MLSFVGDILIQTLMFLFKIPKITKKILFKHNSHYLNLSLQVEALFNIIHLISGFSPYFSLYSQIYLDSLILFEYHLFLTEAVWLLSFFP